MVKTKPSGQFFFVIWGWLISLFFVIVMVRDTDGGQKKAPHPTFPSAAERSYLALNPCYKEISCSNFLCKYLTDHLEDSDRHHTPNPLLNSNFLTELQF